MTHNEYREQLAQRQIARYRELRAAGMSIADAGVEAKRQVDVEFPRPADLTANPWPEGELAWRFQR